jgi:hypothetical protein
VPLAANSSATAAGRRWPWSPATTHTRCPILAGPTRTWLAVMAASASRPGTSDTRGLDPVATTVTLG